MSEPAELVALPEYRAGASAVLPDARRWPLLTPQAAATLHRWRTHPDAPAWTHATGDRLTPAWVAEAQQPLPLDGWLEEHLARARRLMFYRDMRGLDRLEDFPLIGREDLMRDVAAFVPLDADMERMVHGSSSGSTGAALVVPDDVVEVARTFHLIRDLVRAQGVDWEPDEERMALAYVVNQRDAFTYVSLISGFAMRPMVRVNLHGAAWTDAGAAARFLGAAHPQVISGDPASLAALLEEPLASAVRPLAVVSGGTALTAPLRAAVEEAFACPVLDVYGLHETRPLAYRVDNGPLRVLRRRIVVEVVDSHGVAVPDGEVGEVVVTVGENPWLPLVRYRTGDFAARVVMPDGAGALTTAVGLDRLEGRENTMFVARDGTAVPCIDLTQHLQAHGAWGWTVVQDAAGAVHARVAGGDVAAITAALTALLGGVSVRVELVDSVAALGPGKPRRFRCDAKPSAR